MRVAFISDVHANLEALVAVLRDIETSAVEKVFFLGDAVGYGADPNKCVKLINDLCEVKLIGNHDYVALGKESPAYFNDPARQSIEWTSQVLKSGNAKILSSFDVTADFVDCHMVHATPDQPLEWNYLLTLSQAATSFDFFTQGFCFVGHSHIPAVFCQRPDGTIEIQKPMSGAAESDCRYIVNAGSVGQPRDGNPDACYVIFETNDNRFEFRRVSYPVETAQKKMKKARLPELLIARLANGR